jgi:tetratricopeptide (TPR) repeat protein
MPAESPDPSALPQQPPPPTEQELEAIARERLPEALRDARYPRTGWQRVGRWLLRWAWVGFGLYVGQALSQLVPAWINGQTITGQLLADALLLGRVLPMLGQAPLVALAVATVLLVLVVLAGLWAHRDREGERRVLTAQDEWIAKEVGRLHAAARAEQAREAAEAAAQEHVAQEVGKLRDEVAGLGGRSPDPQGPPFDEGLLLPPERLIGREAELTWLLDRLRTGGTTAITALRGLGGIGKSALAAVAIRQLHQEGRYPDGIAVVLAAGLTNPVTVLIQALTRFDPLRRPPEATDLAGLAETAQRLLADKKTLIVLDNIEPGWPVEQVVAPLAAAGATVLLTARQALSAAAVPEEGSKVLDLLTPAQALELFAQSYGKGTSDYLSPAERAAAERITKTLENHTLAVKLAGSYAAQTHRDLSTLAGELERDPLAVPEGETPRGVALVLGRSIEALDAEARRLFGALAAFATPEVGRQAALAVGDALGLADTAASLTVLTLRALVEGATNAAMTEDADRERLRLHALLRAEAQTEMAGWPEAERTQAERAVAAWYGEYANTRYDDFLALVTDEANLNGALEWSHERDEYELVARLCNGLRNFWRDTGHTRAGLRYLPWGQAAAERVAQATGTREDRRRAANITGYYGDILRNVGRLGEADTIYQADLALRREIGDRQGEGVVLTRLGLVAQARVQLDAAEGYFQQALAIDREVQDRQGEGVDLSYLGQVALARGQLEAAEGYFQQSLAFRREAQDRRGEGLLLSSLGQMALARGQLEAAEGYCQQALVVLREVQDRKDEGVVLYSLALIAEARGDLDRAEALHRESLAIALEVQNGQDTADSYAYFGAFLIAKRNQRDEGCAMLAEAARLYDEMGVPSGDEVRATAKRLGCG